MSHIADFSLQADETPCTILYTIGDQKVDVGMATIMEPKEPLFHSRPIPPNVFKVSMASVKPGHENLVPPTTREKPSSSAGSRYSSSVGAGATNKAFQLTRSSSSTAIKV